MKTAVSVPNEVFARAERLAKRLKVSRSELYSRALIEYVTRHSPEEVTEAWDQTLRELGQPADEFTRRAARQVLERIEW
jgi:predicted transcriptional regulator